MTAVEAAALADRLACCVQPLDAIEQRAQLALFRLLAQGEPVPTVRLAAQTGLSDAAIERCLERWHGVRRADGAVVAFQGLSLIETAHRLRVGGRELFTWCAWDTLFLPELLGWRAEVESACPETGALIFLTIDRRGPVAVAPAGAVMSFRPDSPVFVDTVQQSFCRFVHFFSSAAAAESWVAERPGTTVISLEAGFEIGRRTNAAQFGAALRPIIELLYFDGCPSHEQLLPTVERIAAETGAELEVREVETAEAAERERFLGSPTVRINGVDVDPTAAERDDFGLTCRIYRSAEGDSPLPPERWIRACLRA